MSEFATMSIPRAPDRLAPDGAEARLLLQVEGGGLAHFQLPPGATSQAVSHRRVEEIWYFLGGEGELWRKSRAAEEVVVVRPGVCLTIPVGTHFQFRSFGPTPLSMIVATIPRWPPEGDAYPVEGPWRVTEPAGG